MIDRALAGRLAPRVVLALLLVVPLGACSDPAPREAGEAARDEHAGEAGAAGGHGNEPDSHADAAGGMLAHVTAEQRSELGITVRAAGPGTIDAFTELPGEVRANGDRLAHIVPRYPGVVREVRKTVGDVVHAGDVLAVVESSASLASYPLTTAIDGVVIEKHLTKGEAIDTEKGAFVVADLSDVWVDLAVYQKDLDKVARGQAVRVSAGKEVPPAEGTVSYLTPTVDPPTRTATARVVLPNGDGRWRPGMFVTGRVLAPLDAELVVPLAAVQTFAGSPVVFLEAPGGFLPRPVRLGTRGESQVAVLSGLAPGERYAASNTFLLKAELGKADAEHDH